MSVSAFRSGDGRSAAARSRPALSVLPSGSDHLERLSENQIPVSLHSPGPWQETVRNSVPHRAKHASYTARGQLIGRGGVAAARRRSLGSPVQISHVAAAGCRTARRLAARYLSDARPLCARLWGSSDGRAATGRSPRPTGQPPRPALAALQALEPARVPLCAARAQTPLPHTRIARIPHLPRFILAGG